MQIPYDTQLEENVVASMLLDPNCITDVMEYAGPDEFYVEKYQKLCDKMYQVWRDDPSQLDFMMLAPYMQDIGINISKLTDVMASIPSTQSVEGQAKRLRDIAALRRAIKTANDLLTSYRLRDSDDIREAILKAESELSNINTTTVKIQTTGTIKDALLEYHEDFENAGLRKGISGIASGMKDLDDMTSGFKKTELIIVAARPSMGKTAVMNQISVNASEKEEGAVVIFSLEMAKKALAMRMIANEGRIDLQELQSGTLKNDDYQKYTMAHAKLATLNIIIDDQAAIKVSEMRAKLKRIQRERGLSLVLIDYLGLIGSPEKGLSRYEQVSENTRLLKNMAKDFNVPVVCLSQLSRAVEQRQDKRPMMSDIRESGEVEQTADLIMFLYRDDYYDKESKKKNILDIILGKQRNGPTGTVEVAFFKEFGLIQDLERRFQP